MQSSLRIQQVDHEVNKLQKLNVFWDELIIYVELRLNSSRESLQVRCRSSHFDISTFALGIFTVDNKLISAEQWSHRDFRCF